MNTAQNPGVHIWQQGRIISGLFACPVQQQNRSYTVAIFDAEGNEWTFPNPEYDTVNAAIRASIDKAVRMNTAITELNLAHRLKRAGLLDAQKVATIERQAWQWLQTGE